MGAVASASAVTAEHQLIAGKEGIARERGGLFKAGPEERKRPEDLLQGAEGAVELTHGR